MNFLSETCVICNQERKRIVRLMEIQGETICPVCRLEEENRRLEKEMNVFRYEKEEKKT